MATTFDTPAQYERDLRSTQREYKRSKDARVKWSHGTVEEVQNEASMGIWGVPRQPKANDRPKGKPVGKRHPDALNAFPAKKGLNVTKAYRPGMEVVPLRSRLARGQAQADEEMRDISRSIIDLLPSPHPASATDGFLYSFDNVDSPVPTLSLGNFMDNVRETEKFVAREYEILDGNGEAVKGKKARRSLRKPANSPSLPSTVPTELEEEGFELL